MLLRNNSIYRKFTFKLQLFFQGHTLARCFFKDVT